MDSAKVGVLGYKFNLPLGGDYKINNRTNVCTALVPTYIFNISYIHMIKNVKLYLVMLIEKLTKTKILHYNSVKYIKVYVFLYSHIIWIRNLGVVVKWEFIIEFLSILLYKITPVFNILHCFCFTLLKLYLTYYTI